MSYFPWLRRIVAMNFVVLAIYFLLALVSVSQIVLEWIIYWLHSPEAEFEWMLKEVAFQTFAGSWIAIAAFYGLLRGLVFHPIADARYHAWLMRSPWEVGKPLPKGPVHPGWQDGVALGLFTLIVAVGVVFFDAPKIWISGPLAAGVAGLVVSWTGINLLTRQWAAKAVLLLVPLSILFPMGGVGFVGGMLGAVGIAYYGVWKLLSDLHDREPFGRKFAGEVAAPLNRRGKEWQKNATVGWPYHNLLHEPDNWRLSSLQSLKYAAIASTWMSVAIQLSDEAEQQEGALIIAVFLTVSAVVLRIVLDGAVMCPRFCLGHRLAKRQFFVPEHDRLFLWPLFIALGGTVPQGQRTLSPLQSKDLREEVVIPTGHTLLTFDACFCRMLFEESNSQSS